MQGAQFKVDQFVSLKVTCAEVGVHIVEVMSKETMSGTDFYYVGREYKKMGDEWLPTVKDRTLTYNENELALFPEGQQDVGLTTIGNVG